MSDNLVLEHLRYIRGSVDGLREDIRELKMRMTSLEVSFSAMRREIAGLTETDAHIQARLDRQGERLDRIERRLDIVDG